MAIDSIVKQLAENSLSDTEKLKLISDLETSIRRKKEESDLLGEAAKQIANRIKTTEKLFKQSVEEMRQIAKVPGPVGKDGKDGKQGPQGLSGLNGRDGKNGQDGKDGEDGQDGKSIVDVFFAMDGNLVCVLSDGTEIDAGVPLGQKGGSGNTLISNWAGYSTEELKKVFIEHTFETVNKNLPSSDATLTYDANDDLVTVEYSSGVIKTLTYNAEGDLITVVLSGDTPENIMLTKTLGYDGTGNLVSVTYS